MFFVLCWPNVIIWPLLLATLVEHESAKAPVSIHMKSCGHSLSMDDVSILTTCTKSVVQIMTFEAFFINQLKPELNSRDDDKIRVLVVKFWGYINIFLIHFIFVLLYCLFS